MKLHIIFSVLFWVTSVWSYLSPAQLEILDLHYKIQPKNVKGNNTPEMRTFYSILSVPSNVGDEELEKTYKKLTRKWHPDKFARKDQKVRKQAERKYETITLVVNILRDIERRKNYDYFLKNGFPVWDEQRHSYVFKNRSKPSFMVVMVFLLTVLTLGQIGLKKLNKSQANKRIQKILRDVRWKADNQEQRNQKVMELPDDFGVSETPIYSTDDKLVTYCGRVFIVKPDKSVLLYNDDSLDPEDEASMNEVIKKILDSGHFNLYGFEKRPMNRRERRSEKKQKDTDAESDVMEKLVQFKEDDSPLELSSLLVLKPFFSILSFFKKDPVTKTPESTKDSEEIEPVEQRVAKDGTITLPNGTVLHSRKK